MGTSSRSELTSSRPSGGSTVNRLNRAAVFVAVAFGLSWSLALAFFALGGQWRSPAGTLVGIVYMFTPMTAALIVQKFICREPIKGPLGISFRLNKWFVIALLAPAVAALAAFAVALLRPGVTYSPEMAGVIERLTPGQVEQLRRQMAALPVHPFWMALAGGLVAGATVNAVAGFGEELGWRGFLQRELSSLGFWKSSWLVGVVWGVWHAPIILQGHNYPDHPRLGVAMMVVFCVLCSPLFAYVRPKARSVVAAAVMHGALNGTVGLSFMMLSTADDLRVGMTGLAGFFVLALANLLIYAAEREPEMVESPVQEAAVDHTE